MKTMIVLLVCIAAVSGVMSYASGDGTTADKTVKALVSDALPLRNEAYKDHVANRKSLVRAMLAKLKTLPEGAREIKDPGHVRAIWVLGRLREPGAATALAKRIGAQVRAGEQLPMSTSRVQEHKAKGFYISPYAACQEALVRIGLPGVESVARQYVLTGKDEEATCSVIVGGLGYDVEAAKAWITARAKRASPKGSASLSKLMLTIDRMTKRYHARQQVRSRRGGG